MKYAAFNEDGRFLHVLLSGVHDVPASAIEISNDQERKLLTEQDGVWMLINGEIVKAPLPAPPEPTLDALKGAKINSINSAFTQAAAALTEGYPEAERMTWATQQAEALAWDANSAAPTPYLDGLAQARQIDPLEMRQKTLQQTQLFMAASQQLVGKRQRLRDLVYEATSPEALDAIQWDEPAA